MFYFITQYLQKNQQRGETAWGGFVILHILTTRLLDQDSPLTKYFFFPLLPGVLSVFLPIQTSGDSTI